MMIQHKAIVGMVACAVLCSMNNAFGVITESFADDAPAVWKMPVLGFDSAVNDHRGADVRHMLGGTETRISIDLLSENENPNGWGVSGANLKLVLEKDNEWTVLDATADGQGRSPAPGWDAATWIDRLLDSGLTNSNIDFTWYSATSGAENGLNNIYVGNIVAIPEPATYGLITIFGGGLLLFRRRFKL